MKKMTSIIIGVVIIVILVGVFLLNKKSSEYEIIEHRDFSCSNMTGFTFKYPVFKKWPNVSLDHENCKLSIKDSKNYTLVVVQVSVSKGRTPSLDSSLNKNFQGVSYILNREKEEVLFILGIASGQGDVSVKIGRLPILRKNQSISGFSGEKFLETVIESFKITKLGRVESRLERL